MIKYLLNRQTKPSVKTVVVESDALDYKQTPLTQTHPLKVIYLVFTVGQWKL